MKKVSLILLPIVMLAFALGTQVLGQDSESNDIIAARRQYLSAFDSYNDVHKQYVIARDTYNKFGTIAALQNAVNKAKGISLRRADVLGTYLEVIKLVMNSKQYLDESLRKSQTGKIEATQAFLNTHKENVTKAQSRAEINAESQRLEREWPSIQALSYETLAIDIFSDIKEMEARTTALFDKVIQDKGPELSQTNKIGAEEVRNKLNSAHQSVDEANNAIQTLQANPKADAAGTHKFVKKQANEAQGILIQAAEFIAEIERTP